MRNEHALRKEASDRCRTRAGPSLHRETVLEISGVLDHVGSPLRNQQLTWISCDASADEGWVTYLVHLNN